MILAHPVSPSPEGARQGLFGLPEYGFPNPPHERSVGVIDVADVAAFPGRYAIRPEVCNEVAELARQGVDVKLVDVKDPHALPPTMQEVVDERIAALERSPDGAARFIEPPAMSKWTKLRMRAHALQPLYTPDAATLGGPITPEAYDRPIFPMPTSENGLPSVGKLSAAQIVRAEYQRKNRPEKGEEIIADHVNFVEQDIDPISRAFYEGSKDGQAIRTRAYAAIDMAVANFKDPDGRIRREGLRCASFACGAAGPVSLLIREMQDRGASFDKAYILDKDPLALAGAYETLESAGIKNEVVDVLLRDLLKGDFTQDIAPGSLDIADLLGLVEYLPDQYAINLLKKVKELMAPGGVVVWGNMLKSRPQQTMFKEVVKWPPLQQRTISESLNLAIQAGYDLRDISVQISAGEGVYANIAMRIPEAPKAPAAIGQLAVAA